MDPLKQIRFYIPLLVVSAVWWIWAISLSINSAPGLLDDGSHIFVARFFGEEGFIKTLIHQVIGVFNGNRFYEIHYTLLGTYFKLFGRELSYWYLAQFGLCFGSAALAGILIRSLTTSKSLGFICFLSVITSSSLADTVRGNFGKSETEMVFFLSLSLVLLLGRKRNFTSKTFGSIFFIFAILAKESGKAFCAGLLIFGLLYLLSHYRDRFQKGVTSICLGTFGLFLIWITNSPSSSSLYLSQYFHLDFSVLHLYESVKFYLIQTPDLLLILFISIPLAVWYTAKAFFERSIEESRIFGISMVAVAAAYTMMLLSFRFQNTYYTYVPMFAAILGLFSLIPGYRFFLHITVILICISRLQTIPYNYNVAKTQKHYDQLNYEFMSSLESYSNAKLFLPDIPEDSQLIQEWNYLRSDWFNKRIPQAYGAGNGFTESSYQSLVRQLPVNEIPDWRKLTHEFINSKIINNSPGIGDLIGVRNAAVKAGSSTIRAILPLELSSGDLGSLIDTESLELVQKSENSFTLIQPFSFAKIPAAYGWQLYFVRREPRFYWHSYYPDRWLTPTSEIHLKAGTNLEIVISVPNIKIGKAFSFAAIHDGLETSTVEIQPGEMKSLILKTREDGKFLIKSSDSFTPNILDPSNPDMRKLSGRIESIKVIN